ncbi:uncharacterized protein EI90DRAFT_3130563 [Cantharellus anzutake]|uniref:uncharacterized protein n=1 Tax=Cantharellus anzutake TaxID=1750568 RepID=UPI001904E627|nr:uncharacterized protein EI90DRAFT_3130563 [Cantharellus anzutake]KAF8322943.1 hypothetical protein EI90DRAFT_3130563 [Cantharellus anzutake]
MPSKKAKIADHHVPAAAVPITTPPSRSPLVSRSFPLPDRSSPGAMSIKTSRSLRATSHVNPPPSSAPTVPLTTPSHSLLTSPLPDCSSLGAVGIKTPGVGGMSHVNSPPSSTVTSAERPKISFQEYKKCHEAQKSSLAPTTHSPPLGHSSPDTSSSLCKTGNVALPDCNAPVVPLPFSRPNDERLEASVLLSGGSP